MKFGRNDPCWCGSGKKFKQCHLGREKEAPLPSGQLVHELRGHFRVRTCLHPEAPRNCTKVIQAHTLQRRGALERIADTSRQVATFYPLTRDDTGRPVLQFRGWRKASTFSGFCSKHDSELFAPLERQPFAGNDEQCFLIGYRAICHELFQKSAAYAASPMLQQNLDKGSSFEEQIEIQTQLRIAAAGQQKGIEDIDRMKGIYDAAWRKRDFSELAHCVIAFEGDIALASSGLVHTDFDINGKRLQNLGRTDILMQAIAFGVVATPHGGAVVFSWVRADSAVDQFVCTIEAEPIQNVPSILVEFVFAYVENTFFSKIWWAGLSRWQRDRVQELAGRSIQYGAPVGFSRRQFVGWNNLSISRSLERPAP